LATFQAQVQGLTQLTMGTDPAPSTTELTEFLKDGVINVTDKSIKMDPSDAKNFQRVSAEQTSNASLDLNGAQIIAVVREDGVTSNNWRPCRQISPAQQYLVTDTESLSFASKIHPVYMVEDNGTISVFPAPGADPNTFKVYYINNVPQDKGASSLVYSHSDIKYFVDDKVYLVVLYAAIKTLEAAAGSKIIAQDIELQQSYIQLATNLKAEYMSNFQGQQQQQQQQGRR
jgi:type IV secretory pathway protease TraF